MALFSASADLTSALPACSTIPAPQCETSSPVLLPDVGTLPHDRIAEDRLDKLIADLGDKATQAEKNGDPTGCRIYTDQMYAAIKSRSPAHKARLHEELERRMNEGADYMQWQGRLDAELLAKREQR